ncbi:unnamed protein product [Brachionus calyciflorus]|uniref:FLYWCH-type domain-containing protein n=1 Tax=Brachionus calyciflorus TaxID=104777 RepID=A0A814K5L1_9BILA|nr:unnamed protein product [Brachionus calyciflorus]
MNGWLFFRIIIDDFLNFFFDDPSKFSCLGDDYYDDKEADLDEIIVRAFNTLSLGKLDWIMSVKNRNGKKLISKGHAYTKERGPNTLGKVSWKCEKTLFCNGRGYIKGFEPPMVLTVKHHEKCTPIFKRHTVVEGDKVIKQRADQSSDKCRTLITESNKLLSEEAVVQIPTYNANRQKIQRIRRKKAGGGNEPIDISSIIIKTDLQNTYRDDKFFSGLKKNVLIPKSNQKTNEYHA